MDGEYFAEIHNAAAHYRRRSITATARLICGIAWRPRPFTSCLSERQLTETKALLERGWQVNPAGTWSRGLPFTVLNASDVGNTNPGAYSADRPDQTGRGRLDNPGVHSFFNTAAFAPQAPGTLGSERPNQLYWPHTRRIDASLFKIVPLTKESQLQFRAEIFNVTNTANFAAPADNIGGSNFGVLTQMTAGYTPREIQFVLRFQF